MCVAASFSALLVSTLLGLVLTRSMSEADLHSWGWRIPFLVALPLGLIGLWIRRKVSEPLVLLSQSVAAF
jgi:MHS family proline/betaine transporter-like MFS transporter